MLSLDHSQLTGESIQYSWNERDRLTSVLDSVTSFGYSDASQLTSATSTQSFNYQYDSRFNRIENGQVYDAFNKLIEDNNTRYGYDLAGNLTSKINKLTGVETVMNYNATDRLTSIEQISAGLTTQIASYEYDGRGRRTSKTVNSEQTQFQWSGDVLIGEIDGFGTETTQRYRYGAGWAPLEYTNIDDAYQVQSDHLMTPTALIDSVGSLAWSENRGPFGENLGTTVGAPNTVEFRIGFPGQYHDVESELSYNYHRYYDPSLGRYIQSDRIGLYGGINAYTYALGNPVMSIDPIGLLTTTHGADAVAYTYDARGLLSSMVTFEGSNQFSYGALARQVQHIRPGGQISYSTCGAAGRCYRRTIRLMPASYLLYAYSLSSYT